jgi:ATP-dependent helicase/DNAse subunit B
MRLITGPAGSGKTAHVLEEFRQALRHGDHAVRFLVPTATMAQHLQNQVAREGFVLRRSLIQTLSGFVGSLAADFPQAPDAVLYLIVEEAAARIDRPEFRRVADLPGFCARLARAILEFSSAGCDSDRLAACLPQAPLAEAFLAVYREVDRALDGRGLLLRAKRLECAAARIHTDGLNGVATVWLDGFHALPDPELAVIRALGTHADVTLTLADTPGNEAVRARLVEMGFREEQCTRRRATPAMVLLKAPRIEREVEEIARRILEQAASGRPFREMGIIVRAEDAYVPLLRTTLERFGIPARFYFDEDTASNSVTRFLTGAIDAMLGGWDHRGTLAMLRLAPRFADSAALDRLDFAVREQIPNTGLGSLKALLGDTESRLRAVMDALGSLEELRSFELNPADWAARLRTLRNLFRPRRPEDGADRGMAPLWRRQAAALDLFDEALAEAAQALAPGGPIKIEEFWRALRSALRLKPLRVEDGRRNVVHVMGAHEARQWELPVVFVCGMVEKQFPQAPAQDPFFPDAARQRLQQAGIRVRTAADLELEERALFDSAISRATMLVALSYPEFNSRGESNLPSLFLNDRLLLTEDARAVRPAPRHVLAPAGPAAIGAPGLLESLAERTARLSASALEAYLQCPFQYFGTRLLRLKSAPPRPEDRLGFSLQGEIVHAVLAEWRAQPQDIGPLFERIFGEKCAETSIPQGYHTERLRNAMLADLERFAVDGQWPRAGYSSRTEEKFEFPLDESLQIKGRIDRIDTDEEGRAYVIDYKYSAPERLKARKDSGQLQGPVYALAAERAFGVRPEGMFFVGVKKEVKYIGWSDNGLLKADPIPAEWAQTAERVLRIAAEIRTGRVEPAPADRGGCRICDARDVCRIEIRGHIDRGKAAPLVEIEGTE